MSNNAFDYFCTGCGAQMKRWRQFEEYQHDECGGLVMLVDWKALATLSHNLAIAAGLCRAYKIGNDPVIVIGNRGVIWRPGCQRPAP